MANTLQRYNKFTIKGEVWENASNYAKDLVTKML